MTSLMIPRHKYDNVLPAPLDHISDEAWDAAGFDTMLAVALVFHVGLTMWLAPLAIPVSLSISAFMHQALKRYMYASDGLGIEP
jgi:hypothetical protein